jgi:hypothetical protein
MSDLTTGHILGLLETTKAQRATFVADVVENLREGHANPLRVHLQVKCMEELVKAIKDNKEYKDLLHEEAVKYGKSFEFGNAKFEVRNGAGKLDYSVCNDPEYVEINNTVAFWEKELKEREDFLKNIPVVGIETVTNQGELITIYPPTKSPAADAIAVTLK